MPAESEPTVTQHKDLDKPWERVKITLDPSWRVDGYQRQQEMEERYEDKYRDNGAYSAVPIDPAELVDDREIGKIRVVCISDTHSEQDRLAHEVPHGDVLIHSGDFTRYKIVVAGNHELTFDPATQEEVKSYMDQVDVKYGDLNKTKDLLSNCIYLQDEMTEVMGIKVYGSPWQPVFSRSAFNLSRGEEMQRVWIKIPDHVDILVTHGPPLGVGDKSYRVGRAGCEDLLLAVVDKVKPSHHVFGHIHEGYGCFTNGQTVFINASTCDKKYQPVNPAVVFDIVK